MKRKDAKDEVQRRTYTVPEAAAVAGWGIMAVYRGVKAGTVPHIRSGRRICIPKFAWHAYIDSAGGQFQGQNAA
jgi:excisionase family DNA binding protein